MNIDEYRDERRKDPEYCATADRLKPILDIADTVVRLRIEHNLTQSDVAKRAGCKVKKISRIEDGLANPSVSLLQRIAADAFSKELKIEFIDKS